MTDYLCPECGDNAEHHNFDGCKIGECSCNKTDAEIYYTLLVTGDQALSEAREALEPFAHPDLHEKLAGNGLGDDAIIFQRNHAVLKIIDGKRASQWLQKYGK